MRPISTATFLFIAASVCAQGQSGMGTRWWHPDTGNSSIAGGLPVAGNSAALGGRYASQGISRPLGGITTPRAKSNKPPVTGVIWPVTYIPDYYSSQAVSAANYYAPPEQPKPAQPIVINQYFTTPEKPETTTTVAVEPEGPKAPGDPLTAPATYYLIAYKNHEIYSAMAYWMEDGVLHYVTTQNRHNQASLNFIDLALTEKLNFDQHVPFALPPGR